MYVTGTQRESVLPKRLVELKMHWPRDAVIKIVVDPKEGSP